MILDTDVLIWYLRGNQHAYDFITSNPGFNISVVTYIELIQGMRNKQELNILRKQMSDWNTQIIYINENISSKALIYIEENFLSHSLEMADALIGATAIVHNTILITGNDKHYKPIQGLDLQLFRP